MKSFVALLLVSSFSVLKDTHDHFHWNGLQCYNCIYVEGLCGNGCKTGENLVTGLMGSNREILAGTYCNFNKYKDATSEIIGTVTTRWGNNTGRPKHHAYCLWASLEREDGKEMIYRSYGWLADPNLDGKTKKDVQFLIGGTTYVADLYICDKPNCNGSPSFEFGVPSLTELLAAVLLKFLQSLTCFGYEQ